jgi:hypothetical protein
LFFCKREYKNCVFLSMFQNLIVSSTAFWFIFINSLLLFILQFTILLGLTT